MKISAFAEEISKALVSGGLDTGMGEYNGLPVITACCRDGKQAAFMPVDPASASPEEAVRDSEKVLAAIRTYRDVSMTGGRPIVVVRDMWERRKEMMRARMLAHCGIFRPVFARNCEVRRIDRATANPFLGANHSYGGASCRYCYGLFAGQILAAAEFSNARKWVKGDRSIRSYEWIRYASLPELRISGGMGRILKQFIRDVGPDDIMSYADLEWSDGQVYRQLGFTEEGIKAPVMFRIDRRSWTRTPVNIPGNGRTDGTAYYRNCGSIKFRLKLTEY